MKESWNIIQNKETIPFIFAFLMLKRENITLSFIWDAYNCIKCIQP